MPTYLRLFLKYQMSPVEVAKRAMSSILDSEVMEYKRFLKLNAEICIHFLPLDKLFQTSLKNLQSNKTCLSFSIAQPQFIHAVISCSPFFIRFLPIRRMSELTRQRNILILGYTGRLWIIFHTFHQRNIIIQFVTTTNYKCYK